MLGIEIAVVFVLILLNGLLAMAELAVLSSRRGRLQGLAKRGHHGAQRVLQMREEPTRFLSTVQAGITLIGVLAGAFSGSTLAERLAARLAAWPTLAPYAESLALGAVVIVITYFSLVVGELAPKRIALYDPERIAARLAGFMQSVAAVAAPAVWVLKGSTDWLLRLFGMGRKRDPIVTEDEVRMLLAEGARAGVFLPKEREMIEGVLRLADRTARAIMTPRPDVVWLEERSTAADVAAKLAERRLSRLPVCRESIDHPLGIVHMKDLVHGVLAGEPLSLASVMVPPLIVLEGTPVMRLLDSFRRERVHMAIVVDEYGATEGVVTLADILEALAGDLPEMGETPEPGLLRRDDGSWLVDGGLAIDEFEDGIGSAGLRGSKSYETVAGYVLYRLGRLPKVGESFTDRHGRFEVVDMDGHRIDKLVFTPLPEDDG
jgi:magnesium and cobalt exporter, CNNM family